MTLATIFALVKLFDKPEYAKMVVKGQLYMNTIDYFRRYQDSAGELGGDSFEGVSGIFQPSKLGPHQDRRPRNSPGSPIKPRRHHGL